MVDYAVEFAMVEPIGGNPFRTDELAILNDETTFDPLAKFVVPTILVLPVL
jgi:hypothetical protein